MKRLLLLPLFVLAACDSEAPPSACGSIAQVTVNAGETAVFTACFSDPNGDMLTYSATSSNPGVATASMSGTSVTTSAVAPGNASVTITATDPGGLQGQQIFSVTVPNRPPLPQGTIPAATVPVGQAVTVDASSYFNEPDGETLTYSATSSNPAVVTVSVSGGTVRVEAVAQGSANVSVTATDPGGLSATQTLHATVPNRAPVAGDPIPDLEVFAGDAVELDASEHFTDPDGDALAYDVATSDAGVARVSVSGGTVRVEAVAQGSANVSVTATDPGGLSATLSFTARVPNRAPVAGDPIPDLEVFAGDAVELDASEHFTDPDGDALAYDVATSDAGVARVSVSGGTVRVEAVAQGSASVSVTATDPGGLSATLSFTARVPNRAPVAGDPIPDLEVFAGDAVELDASEHFTDPDGDALAYDVATSDAGVARVSVSGGTVRVEAVAQGSATVTVTATDPSGLSATLSFTARVPNRAPVVTDPIPDLEVFAGDAVELDASEHFTDPDGDALAYDVATSDTGVARVSMSGSTVRVEAVAQGSAKVTVTATDPGGLSATLSFTARVPNRAPVAGDPIPDLEVFAGDAVELDASEHFTDPDGDALAYWAATSDASVARVWVSGSTVRVEGVAQGSASVSVTATDPGGLSATLSFKARVPNRAPVAGDPIPDLEMFAGDAVELDASEHFTDPDGDALAYDAATSDTGVARVSVSGGTVRVEAVAQGSANVSVTATDPGGLSATLSFTARVPNRAPVAGDPIPDLEVFAGDAVELDASEHFTDPDGDALAYGVATSDAGVARVSVSGDTVRVEAVAQGSANVTVTATDPGGLAATQTFHATVPNRAPVAGDPIPDLEVFAGDAVELDASKHFTDPDGDALACDVATSDTGVARVSVSGGTVRVEAVAQGSATVTVTATDPGGLAATQTFHATVPNRAPVAGDPIPDLEVFARDAVELDASEHFTDLDGDALAYDVATSDAGVARVSVSGGTVRVEAVAQGSANVTVTATDPGGLAATQTFHATVPNRAPVAGDPIPDLEMFAGDAVELDASEHFTDPDGDALACDVATSDAGVARVSVSGGTVRVEAVAQGSAKVTVTATDPGGLSATLSFTARVPNRAPVAGDPIPDMEVSAGSAAEVDVEGHFTDPDGDVLAYAAASSNTAVATVSVSGSVVTVMGEAAGTATIMVTATDPDGLSATQTFRVTFGNRAPRPVGTIPDLEVVAGSTAEVDVEGHFTDPDGDVLAYAAASSNTAVATVSVSGSVVTVMGEAAGTATVTVTATDPDGLSATLSFTARVPNRAPVAGDPIPDMEVSAGSAAEVDVEGHFTDPDGDVLAYAASSSNTAVATVSVSGSVVTVMGEAAGTATITVTATDPDGLSATQTFRVTVGNRAPRPVGTIPDLEVVAGSTAEVDVEGHFTDPDGDVLAYAAASSNTAVATVSVSGSVVTVMGEAAGTATITVTATDPGGLSATQTFRVTVGISDNPDRAVLVELYNGLGGNNWTRNTNWLTDAHLETWYGVTTNGDDRVVRLELPANRLTGSIPASIGRLSALVSLDLRENRTGQSSGITGTIPPELGNLTNLTQLSLSGNSLTGPIPGELGNLVNLETLRLSDNSLTGPIPGELGNLVNLETLRLSDNSLTGPIPGELGNLVNLETLRLSDNSLTGPIPGELGNLGSLGILFVDGNHRLSGPLPLALEGLPLHWFNYSTTNLCVPGQVSFREWLNGIANHSGTVDCLVRLTNNNTDNASPAWSPDGTKIAFRSNRDGNWEIYVMDADGTDQTNLTNNSATDANAAWSPDGTKIAFRSNRDGKYRIYVMDADGTNQTKLTNNAATEGVPAWSPDGTKIAFNSDRDGNYEIYVMDADGTNQTRLTNNDSSDYAPAWSPDGTQIAFYSNRDGNVEIYVMDADGTDQTNLTNNAGTDAYPSWSPDGTQIAFHSTRDGKYEIYVMDADGTDQTKLTNTSAADRIHPAWSPDGTKIAFGSLGVRDDNWEVYVLQIK